MRIIVLFDLPTNTKAQRKVASEFRKFLLKDGYTMYQYSVYTRTCSGWTDVNKHKERLKHNKPMDGIVRVLVVTEKQFSNIEHLVGTPLPCEQPSAYEQLSIF